MPIRLRITLATTCLMIIALAALGTGMYITMSSSLQNDMDNRLGRVYTRSELLELLRDYEALDQDEKTINVHVSHLRDKIEDDPAAPAFVLTVRGVGYAFAER